MSKLTCIITLENVSKIVERLSLRTIINYYYYYYY
jgi:hypothetical protein